MAYPILLTARDESRVAGESGLPLNVGPLPSSESIVPAAGLDFPAAGDWWVAVESPLGKAGRYRIKLWVGDLTPPRISVLGQSMEGGRRVLRVRIVDTGSGVNPGGVTVSGGGSGRRSVDFDARDGHRDGRPSAAPARPPLAAHPGTRSRRDEGRAVRVGAREQHGDARGARHRAAVAVNP